jgi:hypothetical protein
MVAFMLDHVLKQEEGVVVSRFVSILFLNRLPHGAVVEHLRGAATVPLDGPLLLGQASGKLGGVLGDEDEPHIEQRLNRGF